MKLAMKGLRLLKDLKMPRECKKLLKSFLIVLFISPSFLRAETFSQRCTIAVQRLADIVALDADHSYDELVNLFARLAKENSTELVPSGSQSISQAAAVKASLAVFASGGPYGGVFYDLSRIDLSSRDKVNEQIQMSLKSFAYQFISIDVKGLTSEAALKIVIEQTMAKFKISDQELQEESISYSGRTYETLLDKARTVFRLLLENKSTFSKLEPLTIYIANFEPSAKVFDSLATAIRDLLITYSHKTRNLKFVVTSSQPVTNWGAELGGMNDRSKEIGVRIRVP